MNTPRIVTVYIPGRHRVGTCLDCLDSLPRCAFHAAQAAENERLLSAALRGAAASHRAAAIARVCARFELESDEGGTREEKAAVLIERGIA